MLIVVMMVVMLMFKMMAMDIESTVGHACELCMHDTCVSRAVRDERAATLVKLGRVLQVTLIRPGGAGRVRGIG